MFLFNLLFSIALLIKPDPFLYVAASATLEVASQAVHFTGRITQKKECFFISSLCDQVAKKALGQALKKRHDPFQVWETHNKELKQIPAFLESDKKLISFLQKRFLYKFAGFDSFLIQYFYPCFGMNIQIHPDSTASYERDPSEGVSKKYSKISSSLSPLPLVLTRPFNLNHYFPSYFKPTELTCVFEELKAKLENEKLPLVIDLTAFKESQIAKFFEQCKEKGLDSDQIIGIQFIKKDEIGAIVLVKPSEKKRDFLLNLISRSGLTANGIELDRCSEKPFKANTLSQETKGQNKENFAHFLKQVKPSSHPQKNLMLQATLKILNSLITSISDEKYQQIQNTSAQYIAERAFARIEERLKTLSEEKSFFEYVTILEKVHAEMTALIEIFGNFSFADFSNTYQSLLTKVPEELKAKISCTLHSSAMTSFAALVKCAEKQNGQTPLVLYGSNTYYECIDFADYFAKGCLIDEASSAEWQEVDIILTQFHPVLNLDENASYKMENVAAIIHKTLAVRENKPLTIALDCTFDYIDSQKAADLLKEFQSEIAEGKLNFALFRSGAKFDMLGMDNYWGAPFFMVHNGAAHWDGFNDLLENPLLLTDRLSLNWFCLSYMSASSELENYRRQIFENTRKLLNQAPLFDPMEISLEPAFCTIKVHGSLHAFKSQVILAYLALKNMEHGYPLFFRPSIGFFHTNCGLFHEENFSNIRLTIGLDPAEVDFLTASLKEILHNFIQLTGKQDKEGKQDG